MPMFMKAVLAGLVGLGAYAVVSSGAFVLTQKTDPTLQTLERNRWLVTGAGAVGGAALAATKSPLFGAAIAGGSIISMLGIKVVGKIQELLNSSSSSQVPVAAVYGNLSGYVPQARQIGAYQARMNAVYGNMGAVYGNMGAPFTPAPPWVGNNPMH